MISDNLMLNDDKTEFLIIGTRQQLAKVNINCIRVGSTDVSARSKTLGDRAFMVAAPRLWNSLPKELRAITNVNSFKAHIKTYLFKTLYW
ncbi:unnamed protein product [Porites evermanni]|uniref:Uncharacterized protein n=1 Tax=Porites evermanni TaxID=104178 RepID=A0ABN8LF62_9CNID|nr:unnamed protein product [Porites evermanni]